MIKHEIYITGITTAYWTIQKIRPRQCFLLAKNLRLKESNEKFKCEFNVYEIGLGLDWMINHKVL